MSLLTKTSTFEVYRFDNNFKLEGLLNVLQDRPTKDIFGTNDLEYTSFEGHCSDYPSRFFHNDQIIAFNLNIQEKVFNKTTLKKKFKEAHAEYNGLKRLSASERREIELSVKTHLAPKALVKTNRTSFLINLEKKTICVGVSSRHLNALGFLEKHLGMKRLRQRSLFSESVSSKAHSELATEMFFKWFFKVANKKIENTTPLFVKIDGEVKLSNKNNSLYFKGDKASEYLDDFSSEESKIKQLKLNISSSEEPLAQVYSFRLNSKIGRIANFSDSHFKVNKDELASVSYVTEKYRSLSDFLNVLDTLIYSFEEWFKQQDLADYE